MKKNNLIVSFVAVALMFFGCSEKYDDSELRGKISELDARLTQLEAKVNADIAALQALTSGNVFIKSVVTESGVTTITFDDDNSVVISSGEGGGAPVITVGEEGGVYYWKVNGNWLLDDDEHKVPTTGAAGIAPQVRINNDTKEWEISTDGGNLWTSTGVNAEGQGSGSSIFAGIDNTNPDWVEFTLADGVTKIRVPKIKEMGIILTLTAPALAGQRADIHYDFTGGAIIATLVRCSDNATAEIDNNTQTLSITVPDPYLYPYPHYSDWGNVAVTLLMSDGISNAVYTATVPCVAPFQSSHKVSQKAMCIIPARDFDLGFKGYAYDNNNPDPGCGAGQTLYRATYGQCGPTVNVETNITDYWCSVGAVGANVGDSGTEWLSYTVDVEDEGNYMITAATSWPETGNVATIEVDGVDADGYILKVDPTSFENNTGSVWNSYTWSPGVTVHLTTGKHRIKYKSVSFHNLLELAVYKAPDAGTQEIPLTPGNNGYNGIGTWGYWSVPYVPNSTATFLTYNTYWDMTLTNEANAWMSLTYAGIDASNASKVEASFEYQASAAGGNFNFFYLKGEGPYDAASTAQNVTATSGGIDPGADDKWTKLTFDLSAGKSAGWGAVGTKLGLQFPANSTSRILIRNLKLTVTD